MQTMYPAIVNSPLTSLVAAIDDTQDTIEVADGSKLPDAPNLATIGGGENAETVLYTGKSGNTLTGVTRGFQGTARAWSAGTQIGRFFTEYDYAAMKTNIEDMLGEQTADPSQVPSGLIGTFKQWVSWFTNRIKAITGKTNWYDTPRTTLENAVKRDGDTMTGDLVLNKGVPRLYLRVPGRTNDSYLQWNASTTNDYGFDINIDGISALNLNKNGDISVGNWTKKVLNDLNEQRIRTNANSVGLRVYNQNRDQNFSVQLLAGDIDGLLTTGGTGGANGLIGAWQGLGFFDTSNSRTTCGIDVRKGLAIFQDVKLDKDATIVPNNNAYTGVLNVGKDYVGLILVTANLVPDASCGNHYLYYFHHRYSLGGQLTLLASGTGVSGGLNQAACSYYTNADQSVTISFKHAGTGNASVKAYMLGGKLGM
ncbi:hypothetical protein P4S83_01830 [Aneurinibacillus thermoaerophilus]|uniref:hypothetical protein n=1 Tax=Aneurinibacillus thermoaerophilus TaxID=143495 RepID=UPI002E1D397E|nr:hypothetical protein [Aneurinibacillus thermoaerophilus]